VRQFLQDSYGQEFYYDHKRLLGGQAQKVSVGYCTTSYVDPGRGLFYVGKAIQDLAFCEPEEVMYLLYHGKEGSSKK